MRLTQRAKSENPFYGRTALLALQEALQKRQLTVDLLEKAQWSIKTTEDEQLLHILCFSAGDITNRQHYMFNQDKIVGGGEASNDTWLVYLKWLLQKHPTRFISLMPLMVEYVGLRELLTAQIRTKKGTKQESIRWGLLEAIQANTLVYNSFLNLLASFYKGKPYQQWLLAKHLVTPQRSSRQAVKRKTGEKSGRRDLQDSTESVRASRIRLFSDLSAKLGLEVITYPKNKKFVGLEEFRRSQNQNLESVLFSTKKILTFDKDQFLTWVDTLPSGARFNTRKRLLDKDNKPKEKWARHLAEWFLEWETFKETKQQEKRELEVKIAKGEATVEDKEKFVQVAKEAKVTTGGKTLFEYLQQFLNAFTGGSANVDSLTVQSIVDKTVFNVPVLVAIDNSQSMTQSRGVPINTAYLLATLALLKNPSTTAADMIIRFGSHSTLVVAGAETSAAGANRFMGTSVQRVTELVDRTKAFPYNFNNVASLLPADMGSTNFSGIPEQFKAWVDKDPELSNHRREQINQYPVLLVLTDGDFNNAPTATASMLNFKQNMLQWFGWDGVVVIWDVSGATSKFTRFADMENVICFSGFNISNVNQIFTKIDDIDIIDIYTPLKSIFLSNRYEPIKKVVKA